VYNLQNNREKASFLTHLLTVKYIIYMICVIFQLLFFENCYRFVIAIILILFTKN